MSSIPKSAEKPVSLPANAGSRSWFRRYPLASLLVALVLAFGSFPFEEHYRDGELIEVVLLTVMMLTALLALGGRRRTLAWGIVLVTPALAGKWVNHWRPDLAPAWVFLGPGLLFVMFVVLQLLRFILRAPRVDSEVLCAGIAGYLMLALLWAFAYLLVARLVPDSFVFTAGPAPSHRMKGFTSLYFSFVTLSTTGYGDIVPASGVARMLAMMEAMTGTFYVAILISRLVALYSSPHPAAATHDPGNP